MDRLNKELPKKNKKEQDRGQKDLIVPFLIGAAATAALMIAYDHKKEISRGINKVLDSLAKKSYNKKHASVKKAKSVPVSSLSEDDMYLKDILDLFCPLSHEFMQDPVLTPYGHSYDRKSITDWLRTHQTDPITNQPLALDDLRPCNTLKAAVLEAIRIQKEAENQICKY